MAQGQMSQDELQKSFRYLFERMSEPLGMGMKGPSNNMVYYNVPPVMGQWSPTARLAPASSNARSSINVVMPQNMPMKELSMISSMCPRNGLFGYFVPQHRQALLEMKKILMAQGSLKDLLNMSCACRDSPMVNSHLFINALASCLASRKDTKGFSMPAFYEVMPDIFFTDHVIKQAEKMARMPETDKNIIMVDRNSTGHQSDPENRLWYFREDVGVNSHHFHWHIVFPGEYMLKKQDRRGELFYYMHHSMIARYDAERLCNSLPRTKLLDFDNLVLEEGYFGKLYSTNAARHWGTRQANTKLQPVLREDIHNEIFWDLRVEDLKRWRDRILEAIDTGYIIKSSSGGTDSRDKLTEQTGIDILGDIVENSKDTPHAQFYGAVGFHNMGHVLISFAQDPTGKYIEAFGPMGDTATAMRDPAFYRWHKYIDHLFDQYKRTLPPYQLKSGMWPLVWEGIAVESISVINSNPRFKGTNKLSTHTMQTDIDLARGLDFVRTDATGGPVWARVTHVNYDVFAYNIKVRNDSGRPRKATIRIFMAPRKDEHGDNLPFKHQRLLFFELDKFTHNLPAGMTNITRESTESSVTIKMENSFRNLEKLDTTKPASQLTGEEGRCGCGWPQHLLLPRGTLSGTEFDIFVILTDGDADTPKNASNKPHCREAMSFCGILDEKYPDARPMGYPFDRIPYLDPTMTSMGTPVDTLEAYVKNIPNSKATQVQIVHEPNVVKVSSGGAPPTMAMVNEMGHPVKNPGQPTQSQQMNRPPQPGDGRGPKTFDGNKGPPRQNNVDWLPPAKGRPRPQWGGPNTAPQGYRGRRQDDREGDWDYVDSNESDDMNVDSPDSRY